MPNMSSFVRIVVAFAFAFAFSFPIVEAASNRPKGDFRHCLELSSDCPIEATLYGYRPNLGANAFFAALFAICFIATISIGVLTKTWTYTLALGIGTFLEAAGYGGRVMMNGNPWSESGMKLQICCLVLGPSFVAASIYLTLKHFVLYCGPQHSLLKPNLYPWIFIGCDIGSIVLQGVGGGMAAAGGSTNKTLIDGGSDLIVAGIAFQVFTMAVCGILVVLYIYRYRNARALHSEMNDKSNYELDKEQANAGLGKVKFFGWLLILAYTTVLIRCIYRLPEMAGGWGNRLMRNEVEFLLLDGMMIAIACLVLTGVHPAYFFPPFAAFRRRK